MFTHQLPWDSKASEFHNELMIYRTSIINSKQVVAQMGPEKWNQRRGDNNHLNETREGRAPTINFRERNNGHRHHNSVDITQRQCKSNHGGHLHPLGRDELQKTWRRRRNRTASGTASRTAAGAAALFRAGLPPRSHGRDTNPTGGLTRSRPNADEPYPATLGGNRDAQSPALDGKRMDGGGEGKGQGEGSGGEEGGGRGSAGRCREAHAVGGDGYSDATTAKWMSQSWVKGDGLIKEVI